MTFEIPFVSPAPHCNLLDSSSEIAPPKKGPLMSAVRKCPCCGSSAGTIFEAVMWKGLGEEWGLSEEEYSYIDRQQGERCKECRSNLRSQALAIAVLQAVGFADNFRDFTGSLRGRMLRILEINTAGDLSKFFRRRSRHHLRCYPEIDMMDMRAIADGSFDLVLHSDTLEHVPDPIKALSECHRVLRPGGALCFTIPIVVGRLSRRRDGLPKSYHGSEAESAKDLEVVTEYGADAWRQVLIAGFNECRIISVAHPAAHALVGAKYKLRGSFTTSKRLGKPVKIPGNSE
jgi:SAM-dependent methyltransferase